MIQYLKSFWMGGKIPRLGYLAPGGQDTQGGGQDTPGGQAAQEGAR